MNSNLYFKLWCNVARNYFAATLPGMELRVAHNREFSLSPELFGIHSKGMDGTMIMSRSAFLKQFGHDQTREPAVIENYINYTGGFTSVELMFNFAPKLNIYAECSFENKPFCRAKGTMVALRKALSQTEKGLATIKEIDRLTNRELRHMNNPKNPLNETRAA